ncbi:MAG TPA: glycosyltransferase [Candidatus Omnitrophota bacterium]|nr:glycosyltransferase [Candidatus Omnitrophota bacterium]HSA31644.1 glycosyltransferase [Candidatus Omnitrophota bacterium]
MDRGVEKKDLFVTLADRDYLRTAKQIFASVFFNAGWKGDYMLLAHDVPEDDLVWFRKKGILIKHCAPLFRGGDDLPELGGMKSAVASKFYLFTPEFKKWRTVIYSDSDATVRASLDGLRGLKGFHSVEDATTRLWQQVIRKKNIQGRALDRRECRRRIRKMRADYDLNARPFCAGFFVFSSEDVIDGDRTFQELCQLLAYYGTVSEYGDQLTFNLYFRQWKPLPVVYNIQFHGEKNRWLVPPSEIHGIVLHFVTAQKPWIHKTYFWDEWSENLNRADRIDLSQIPDGVVWSRESIDLVSAELKNILIKRKNGRLWVRIVMDRTLGYFGKLIRSMDQNVYRKLIGIKQRLDLDKTLGVGRHVSMSEPALKKLREVVATAAKPPAGKDGTKATEPAV